MKRFTSRAALSVTIVAGIVLASATSATASPANEVSDAMRYGGSAPLGAVIEGLVGQDDDIETVAAPWPLNFFGEKYEGLCITTNGGVYPVADGSSTCSNNYDESVENLADASNAPMIAVLAADIDLGSCDAARVAQRDGAGDGFGRPCTIYIDTAATIDGRDAVVITWYRVSMYEDSNDELLENTFQLALIKLPTANGATVGFDFDFEFNYGTLRDGEDGYSAAAPDEECTSESDDCRWGIGVANYVADVAVTSETEPAATETPAAPSTEPAAAESTETASEKPAEPTETEEPVNLQPAVATGYEFFADYPVADLLDDGATPLVANSLGTDVDGRYTCGMLSGQTVGCTAVDLTPPTPELAETGPSDDALPVAMLAMLAGIALIGSGVFLAARSSARAGNVRA